VDFYVSEWGNMGDGGRLCFGDPLGILFAFYIKYLVVR